MLTIKYNSNTLTIKYNSNTLTIQYNGKSARWQLTNNNKAKRNTEQDNKTTRQLQNKTEKQQDEKTPRINTLLCLVSCICKEALHDTTVYEYWGLWEDPLCGKTCLCIVCYSDHQLEHDKDIALTRRLTLTEHWFDCRWSIEGAV